MSIRLNTLAASLLVATAGLGFSVSAVAAPPMAGPNDRSDAALVVSVRDAINNKLGDEATDLTITALDGKVTLHGWAKSPKQEEEARQIARKVPGVSKAYSRVRVWSSTDVE
jgi:osmotically-inducible protein OsmY